MNTNTEYDLICVGGGIMSATLALLAKIIKPDLKIMILERLDEVAQESSAAWNNSGTGHSALCELNYCPERDKGEIDISKAIDICSQFEQSRQFWAHLVERGLLCDSKKFIRNVPHHSWVVGSDNADYLEKRYHVMKNHFMFETISFTRNQEVMKDWFPLIMEGRRSDEPMAASRIDRGTEINFGYLTKAMFDILEHEYGTPVHRHHEVKDIDPDGQEEWSIEVSNTKTDETLYLDAKHVFIGAGGGSLLLLQKVEIEEKEGYGGFPVSGEWLVCKNPSVIKQHHAKVYSKAGLGDPPMSVPHLDTRYIDGKQELLFGPFAGFSPKFLKEGSNLDLLKSLKFDNLPSMWGVFWHNLPLTKYLLKQIAMSFDDRMDDLRKFVINARNEDWEVMTAGQRVQTIKRDAYEGGTLEFGTEVISSKDGKITCLMGASPGASTAVKIMLDVLEKAFPEIMRTDQGRKNLDEMVPFYRAQIDKDLFARQLERVETVLELQTATSLASNVS